MTLVRMASMVRVRGGMMIHLILAVALRDGVTEEGFDAIALGMHKQTVLTILNRGQTTMPPKDHAGLAYFEIAHLWESRHCRIFVHFDKQGRVDLVVMQRSTNRDGHFSEPTFRAKVPDGAAEMGVRR